MMGHSFIRSSVPGPGRFCCGGEVVDTQKTFQRHVVQNGDMVRAVALLNPIGFLTVGRWFHHFLATGIFNS